ncbi:hypothetical protein R1sor_006116 [Riccia sorocarpa]|uniref:Uncharacterized protein n=1 Tax=Riccia sorocarpa TaxID=122646 RepID=A0ABD3HQU7_9MARC
MFGAGPAQATSWLARKNNMVSPAGSRSRMRAVVIVDCNVRLAERGAREDLRMTGVAKVGKKRHSALGFILVKSID